MYPAIGFRARAAERDGASAPPAQPATRSTAKRYGP
jgi:hypothetical protein